MQIRIYFINYNVCGLYALNTILSFPFSNMYIVKKEKIESLIPLLKLLLRLGSAFFSLLLLIIILYRDWEEKKISVIYSLPMVFVFFHWLSCNIEEESFYDLRILSVDFIAVLLSVMRMFGLLFHSGHVLFLTYSMLSTKRGIYHLICIPVIVITMYFKLVYWNDYVTPLIGLILAIILIFIRKKTLLQIEYQPVNTKHKWTSKKK